MFLVHLGEKESRKRVRGSSEAAQGPAGDVNGIEDAFTQEFSLKGDFQQLELLNCQF